MSPHLKELIGHLAELENLCGQLIVLTETEREALIGQQLEKLNLITESKNSLSAKILRHRDRARELTGMLNPAGAGAGTKDGTIAALMPLLSPQDRAALEGPYRSYKAVAAKVEFTNAHNRILARQGMKAIEGRVAELVTAIQGADNTYARPGNTAAAPLGRLGRVHREA